MHSMLITKNLPSIEPKTCWDLLGEPWGGTWGASRWSGGVNAAVWEVEENARTTHSCAQRIDGLLLTQLREKTNHVGKSVPDKEPGPLGGDGSAQRSGGTPGPAASAGTSSRGGVTGGTITTSFISWPWSLHWDPGHTESLSKCCPVSGQGARGEALKRDQ